MDDLEEEASFLPVRSDAPFGSTSRTWRKRELWQAKCFMHCLLILFYSATSITAILHFSQDGSYSLQYALPNLRTDQISIRFPLMRDTPFIGHPTPAVEKAWSNLLHNMSLRVSDAELLKRSRTSIPLPRGGNLAWLGVFHELHCIKVLRKANYREHYYPEVRGQELRDVQVHVDHCIELLRASAVCRPDLETLTTFQWREGMVKPLLSPERPLRRCVDWDVLMESIEDRVVSDEEMDELNNVPFY